MPFKNLGAFAVLISLLCCTVYGAGASPPRQEPADKPAPRKILAKINQEPVYSHEVLRRIRASHGDVALSELDMQTRRMLLETTLESEIIDRLLYQTAVRDGMSVSARELDTTLKNAEKMLGKQAFQKLLKEKDSAGGTLTEFLKRRALIDKYKQKLFSAVKIDEKTLAGYYAGHKERVLPPDDVRLETFVLTEKKQADILFKRWKTGESFDDLRREYSEALKRKVGRRTKWMPYQAVPTGLRGQIKSASAGQILAPFLDGGQYYVIKVLEKGSGAPKDGAEAKERVKAHLRRKQEQKIIDAWYAAARKEASIEYLFKEMEFEGATPVK